jgi:hypothetical protein
MCSFPEFVFPVSSGGAFDPFTAKQVSKRKTAEGTQAPTTRAVANRQPPRTHTTQTTHRPPRGETCVQMTGTSSDQQGNKAQRQTGTERYSNNMDRIIFPRYPSLRLSGIPHPIHSHDRLDRNIILTRNPDCDGANQNDRRGNRSAAQIGNKISFPAQRAEGSTFMAMRTNLRKASRFSTLVRAFACISKVRARWV